MKNNKRNQPFVAIFPKIFKLLGLFIILLAFGSIVLVYQTNFLSEGSKQMELIKLISKQSFLTGLFFIVFSKSKLEDERSNQIRLYVFASAFWFGILQVLIYPIINYFIPIEKSEFSAFEIFSSMMLFIIILPFVLQLSKRKVNEE